MKRYLYLFPLMAFTAATLTLGACDDKKKAEDEAAAQTDQTTTAPASDTAMTAAAPAAEASVINAEGANAYATAEGATTGAVFLTLHNPGTMMDKLTGVKTDAATTAEIHESYVDDAGTMQMRKVDSVDIGASQQVTLKPDGYHIMLTGLAKPLVEGQTFNVTLMFEKAPEVTLPVTITAAGAAPATSMDHSTMTHATTDSSTTTSEPTSVPDTSSSSSTPSTDESPANDSAMTPSTTSDAPGTTTTTAPATPAPSDDAQPAQ